MIDNKYNIHDEVYVLGCNDKNTITEISIQASKTEYKLWTQGTKNYTWFDGFQITKDKPRRIGFKTN